MKSIQLSPNSLNLYLECQSCFWLDKKMGIKRPASYSYELNSVVDNLLKEEFDVYRKRNEPHPLLSENNIDAKLFPKQRLLDKWRDSREGIRYYDKKLDATLLGAPDDVLEFENGKLAPLDYKSTGVKISKIYDKFQLQMDIYTFLLEKNGYKTTKKGYLAFYIIDKDRGFVDRLPFRKEIYAIDTAPADVYEIFKDAVELLKNDKCPEHSSECLWVKWQKFVA